MELEQCIDGFLAYAGKQRGYSSHTVKAYGSDLAQFRIWATTRRPGVSFDLLMTRQNLRAFIYAQSSRSLKPRTLARKIATFKSFCRYCMRRKVLADNPAKTLVSPRLDKPLPSFLTRAQADALEGVPDKTCGTHLRDRAIIELFYGSGIRLAELHGLDGNALDRRGLTVRVLGKGRKERIVPLTPQAVACIDDYLRHRRVQSGVLFTTSEGERLSRRQIQRIVNRELSRVSTQKKKSPHVLRHSFATHVMDGGADIRAVKELLGHASLATTQIYTHVSKERLLAAYRQAHPRSGTNR